MVRDEVRSSLRDIRLRLKEVLRVVREGDEEYTVDGWPIEDDLVELIMIMEKVCPISRHK